MRSKRSKVRACACVTYFVTFSFNNALYRRANLDREKPVSCCFFFFFFLVDAEKNLIGISLVMMMMMMMMMIFK